MVVIPVRKRFGIELLLTMAEAIAVGLGSHGYIVPKVIVRLVPARWLHQNSLVSVFVILHHAASMFEKVVCYEFSVTNKGN